MKELIQPNDIESKYAAVDVLIEACGSHCRGCAEHGDHCNRYCSGGSTNTNPVEDNDLLF